MIELLFPPSLSLGVSLTGSLTTMFTSREIFPRHFEIITIVEGARGQTDRSFGELGFIKKIQLQLFFLDIHEHLLMLWMEHVVLKDEVGW